MSILRLLMGRGSCEPRMTRKTRIKTEEGNANCLYSRYRRRPWFNPRLLRRERVLGGVLLRQDLVDLGLTLHGVGDGHFGGVVVVLVDLGVVLGLPVDEDAADDDV